VVKVIRHKAHRRRRTVQCYSTGDSNVSFNKGTLAPSGEYDWTCASFGSLESTTEITNRTVQPFLHSLRQKVPILYNGGPCPPELPLPMGDLDLPRCFRPMRIHNPNGISIGSVIFAQMTAECLYTLQWFACFPLKIASSHVGIWTSRNTWFIWPTRVRNATWSFQLFLQGWLVWQTDTATNRPTYHATRCDAA